jgi:hypothetical protein
MDGHSAGTKLCYDSAHNDLGFRVTAYPPCDASPLLWLCSNVSCNITLLVIDYLFVAFARDGFQGISPGSLNAGSCVCLERSEKYQEASRTDFESSDRALERDVLTFGRKVSSAKQLIYLTVCHVAP